MKGYNKDKVMDEFLDDLKKIVGEKNVSVRKVDLINYARDTWIVPVLKFKNRLKLPEPEAIVWPETTKDVSEILKLANKYKVPVITFGGGAGVVGGVIPTHGGIVLDLKKMKNVIEINKEAHYAIVESGIISQNFEEYLNRFGFTLGHYPMSMNTSTIGGFLATRASGTASTKYGNIEDMVLGLEFVLPTGEIVETLNVPKTSVGPDLKRLIIGSEGVLGVITKITLKIFPIPEKQIYKVFMFKTFDDGMDAIREILQSGIFPAIVRLYDEMDTSAILGRIGVHAEGCVLILRFDGKDEIVKVEDEIASKICQEYNAEQLDSKIGIHWWNHRYDQYFELPEVLEGGIADTIEIAATWDKLKTVYHKIRDSVSDLEILLMAHLSHAYTTGGCIYFTFVVEYVEDEDDPFIHLKSTWDKIMQACLDSGATISHHHGVGIARNPWIKKELGTGLELLRRIKNALDPNNILNPGKLGMDGDKWI